MSDVTSKSNKKTQLMADLGLLFVAMIWGTGFVFSKQAVNEMHPMLLMSIRFTSAFLISALFFCKKLRQIDFGLFKGGVIVGIFLFLAYATQMTGLQYIGAGRQAFETGIYVILVPFGYWLVRHRRPSRYNFIAALIMLMGMACLTLEPGEGVNFNQGDAWTLLCAFLFAAQIIANGFYVEKYDAVLLTIVQLGTASVLSILYCLIAGYSLAGISRLGWLSALYLGFFSTFLCALLQTICQKYTSDSHAAILMCMETVFGSLASFIFLHEYFTPLMIVGFVLIFGAVIISETQLSFLKKKKVSDPSISEQMDEKA